MFDTLHRGRVALVGDDHPDCLAIGRHEHLHATFEVGIVEHVWWQVEQVVILGLVEVQAYLRRAFGQFLLLGLGAGLVLWVAIMKSRIFVIEVMVFCSTGNICGSK